MSDEQAALREMADPIVAQYQHGQLSVEDLIAELSAGRIATCVSSALANTLVTEAEEFQVPEVRRLTKKETAAAQAATCAAVGHLDYAARVGTQVEWWQCQRCGRVEKNDDLMQTLIDFVVDDGYRGPGPDVEPERCELDMPDGSVCMSRLRADGTCPIHHKNT